jgi:hypothetical protein
MVSDIKLLLEQSETLLDFVLPMWIPLEVITATTQLLLSVYKMARMQQQENQFSICAEGMLGDEGVTDNVTSQQECDRRLSLAAGQGYLWRMCICKYSSSKYKYLSNGKLWDLNVIAAVFASMNIHFILFKILYFKRIIAFYVLYFFSRNFAYQRHLMCV